MPLHVPRNGRIVFYARSNPDANAIPVIDPVRLWPRPGMHVMRCDVYAQNGTFRIGDQSVSQLSGSEMGVSVSNGQYYTLPECDLYDWWVVGSAADDVVTWTAEMVKQ